jgi:hypothetical protein
VSPGSRAVKQGKPERLFEVAEDGEHAAVVGVRRRQAELAEDVADVLLHGLLRDHKARGDRAVGPALGHQGQHIALPGREGPEPVGAATGAQQLRHDLRVEGGATGGHPAQRPDELPVYSNQYSDATDSGPVAGLAVAMAIAALTVAGMVIVVATSVLLGRRTAAQRARAVSYVGRVSARRSRKGRYDWALASGLLIVALGSAVLFLPGLVNGVSYLAGGKTATFFPQFHTVSCSYHGNGDCSTVTVGILKIGGGGVRSTWPNNVPLGRPFQVREPVWTWGLGAALIDGDGIAVGAALISLLFDGLAVLAVIFFVNVVRGRLARRRRTGSAPGHS